MKNLAAIAGLLGVLCGPGQAQIIFQIMDPNDDLKARAEVGDRPELKPLHAAYFDLIQTRIWPLTLTDALTVFGPKLAPVTNSPGEGGSAGSKLAGPSTDWLRSDRVLPVFATGGKACGGVMMVMLSGIRHPEPALNKDHADLHAIGDIGYVDLYYGIDGQRVQNAVLYFRADHNALPLKSINDFPKRLKWEKAKFHALNKWLDEHLPSIDLGVIKFSAGRTNRIDSGAGGTWLLTVRDIHQPTVPFWFEMQCMKETANREERIHSWQQRSIDRAGQSVGFRLDGKFYRLTPEFYHPAHEPQK